MSREIANVIKVIFRCIRKNNPKKVLVAVQALEAGLGKHLQENVEIFEKTRAITSTAKFNIWS